MTLPTSGLGGTIQPGTYYETEMTSFTGPGGATGPSGHTRRQTLVLTNAGDGSFTIQNAKSDDAGAEVHQSFKLTPSGTTFTMSMACPANTNSVTWPYTAMGNQLIVYENTGGNLEEVFELQP